jgi:hypothetical protein
MRMTKSQLLAMFYESPVRAAKALGVSRQTIWQWPEKLPEQALMRIRDYYVKRGEKVPAKWMPK